MGWNSTSFKGVRYREDTKHKLRNGQYDKYFTIRYRKGGVLCEESIGWASEGWNAEKAYKILSEIKSGIRTGSGAHSLAEKRNQAALERERVQNDERLENIKSIFFADFVNNYYIQYIKASKRSWLNDQRRLNKLILPELGHLPLRVIRPDHVQAFINKLIIAKLAASTVRQYMAIIRHVFNVASQTYVESVPIFEGKNPAQKINTPAIHNSRDRYLSQSDVKKLIVESKKLRSSDLHDSIIISINTGLRLGEIMRLEWIDIDFEGGTLSVREEARRKPGGKVPLNDSARYILQSRCQASKDNNLVFPPIYGENFRNNISAMFKQIVDKVGLNNGITDVRHKIVFHSLRHTFASWLALAGVDIYRIKTLMRHKNISMTMRYAHLIPDETKKAVHKLPELLK